MHRERLVCDCGAELTRPIPRTCPKCNATITGVRRTWWPLLRAGLFVLVLFGVLIAFTYWFANR